MASAARLCSTISRMIRCSSMCAVSLGPVSYTHLDVYKRQDTQSQTVVVNPDDTQELWFYNTPVGGVELIKVSSADKTEPVSYTHLDVYKRQHLDYQAGHTDL